MKYIFAVLILLFTSSLSIAQDYTCTSAKDDETTYYGGNEQITIIERKSLRQLRGRISAPNGELVENALVEVFTNPEYLLPNKQKEKHDTSEQKRVAACRTGITGKFSFTDLPAGKYELRLSKDSGWNVTQVYILIKPKNGKKRMLEISMSLGS